MKPIKGSEEEEYQLERNEVQFKHLSGWLKTAIVMAFIMGAIWLIFFVIGMFAGVEELMMVGP